MRSPAVLGSAAACGSRLRLPGIAVLLQALIAVAAASKADIVYVTCGSTIKLAHQATGFRLHSHDVSYSQGSRQQSVTAFPTADDGQSYWVAYGPVDAPCEPGALLRKGSKVRLLHSNTRRWLHSHNFHSPMSGNQEISCYGNDNTSDGGDVWVIEWDGKGKFWRQDLKMRLKHVDTGVYLASHAHARFGHPINGQQEVSGVKSKSRDAEWYAAEGVYMPKRSKKEGAGSSGSSSDKEDKDEL